MNKAILVFIFLLVGSTALATDSSGIEKPLYKQSFRCLDQVGLFSQKETKALINSWDELKSRAGISFSCLLFEEGRQLGTNQEVLEFFYQQWSDTNNLIVFYLNHSSREVQIFHSSDLDSLLTPDFKEKIKADVLISNFKKGWWAFGIEEASTRIVRQVEKNSSAFFTWSAAVYLWIFFGIALLVLFIVVQNKNAFTITSEGVFYRNILRNPPKYVKGDSDDRRHFDGGGSSRTY